MAGAAHSPEGSWDQWAEGSGKQVHTHHPHCGPHRQGPAYLLGVVFHLQAVTSLFAFSLLKDTKGTRWTCRAQDSHRQEQPSSHPAPCTHQSHQQWAMDRLDTLGVEPPLGWHCGGPAMWLGPQRGFLAAPAAPAPPQPRERPQQAANSGTSLKARGRPQGAGSAQEATPVSLPGSASNADTPFQDCPRLSPERAQLSSTGLVSPASELTELTLSTGDPE